MPKQEYYLNSENYAETCNCGKLLEEGNSFSHHFSREDDEFTEYNVLKYLYCRKCRSLTISLYTGRMSFEDEFHSLPEDRHMAFIYLPFIRRVLAAPKRRHHKSIPIGISEVVNQAEAVLDLSPRASLILCRAALEEICSNFGIDKQRTNSNNKTYFLGLKDRLKELCEQENLPDDLKSITDAIKEFGDTGAHSDHLEFENNVEPEDAETLLELVQYVLKVLYTNRFEQQEASALLSRLKEKTSQNQ